MLATMLLAVSALSSEKCSQLVPPFLSEAQSVQHHGRYFNPNYCFAVTIPKGLTGLSDPPPAPHHGFGVILPGSPRSYIYTDGSYNAADELTSAWVWAGLHLEWLAKVAPQPHATISAAQLGSSSGVRLVARFECPGDASPYVRDTFLLLQGGVVYTLSLWTTAARYPTDRLAIEEMANSWAFDFSSCHP